MHLNRSSLDDTDVLKKELASVQRLMDELATDKEKELADLQEKLRDLQADHEDLKNKQTSFEIANKTVQLEFAIRIVVHTDSSVYVFCILL